MSKADAVQYAYDLLTGARTHDKDIAVFSCGSYTPSSAMTHGGDYWVNVPERYIATGIAHWGNGEYNFTEVERIDFD
jgi:hypothetical protein